MISQGDVFWVDLGTPFGSGPGYLRPYVVIQNDAYNQSRIKTVVVCGVTANLERAKAPGNVLLEEGEANLPKRSVINISQLYTIDKDELVERIGTLSTDRLREVLTGVYRLLEPYEA